MPKERADAWQIDAVERRAFSINFSIFKGGEFDWSAMQFKKVSA